MPRRNKRLKTKKESKRKYQYPSRSRRRCLISRKVQFVDEAAAQEFIDYITKLRGHKGFNPVRAYHCKHCGMWHTTHLTEDAYRAKVNKMAKRLSPKHVKKRVRNDT